LNVLKVSTIALVALLPLTSAANAHQVKRGPLTIVHPWVHSAEDGALVTDGYVSITNSGNQTERLVGVVMEGAGAGYLIQKLAAPDPTTHCQFKVLTQIAIAPGETLVLKPNTSNLLIFGEIRKQLREDEYVKGQLFFDRFGAVKIEYAIEAGPQKAMTKADIAACAPPPAAP
jgi:periplasmic copper chaperone A